jgi:hypothetical protein
MTMKLAPQAIRLMPSREIWSEFLTCPKCGGSGKARLSQREEAFSIRIESVPAGFDAVISEFGVTFFCGCGAEAVTH